MLLLIYWKWRWEWGYSFNNWTIGELICTVTLNITNQKSTAGMSWDQINSAMQTSHFSTSN